MNSPDHFDTGIIGAGVIGLAVAYKIAQLPAAVHRSTVILDRHRQFGQETSSRNSEVIHAGIYYPKDSLKARLCIEGKHQLYAYCRQHDIAHRQTGKFIFAPEQQEQALARIQKQAADNGVDDLVFVDKAALKRREPALGAGVALLSPTSGIIDSHAYMQSLLYAAESAGALFSPLTEVTGITRHARGFRVETRCQDETYTFTCERLVNSGGLQAQQVSRSIEGFPRSAIPEQVLVKGNYFMLQGKSPFSRLIYPVPETNLKGLGIHVTLDMAGQARFGPDTEPVAAIDYRVDPGLEAKFRAAISRYYPGIADRRLQPGYSGIRPKLAVTTGIADFVIQGGESAGYSGLVQLFGIESPGLTASLAIADDVVRLLDF